MSGAVEHEKQLPRFARNDNPMSSQGVERQGQARPEERQRRGDDGSAVRALFTALIAQLHVGVVLAARDGHFEIENDVARTLFEQHCRPHIDPEPWVASATARNEGLEPLHWIIARVLHTGEVVRDEELEFLDEHNEWRTLSASATPIVGADNEITHALVTFSDVTATTRAREWEPLIRSISRL